MIQPPKIEFDRFWQLLRESQLVSSTDLDRLIKESTARNHEDSEALANWLVSEKILTPLQSEVLQSGHMGPFEFGRYRIIGRGPTENTWVARDRKTMHPVWLHFFTGDSQKDLKTWSKIEKRADKFNAISAPNLVGVYESVVTRSHRFVATAIGGNQPLSEKMPLKRRLTEEQTLKLVREVALPIVAIEEADANHGCLSMDYIFHNAKAGITKVMPPVLDKTFETGNADVSSLGKLVYRLLTGRDAPDGDRIAKAGLKKFSESLSSRKVRPEVSKLVFGAITDPKSFTSKEFLKRVEEISGESAKTVQKETTAREAMFLAGLVPWESESDQVVEDESIPDVENESADAPSKVPKKRKKQLPVAVSIGLSLIGFAACLGIVALAANLVKLDPPKLTVAKSDEDSESETNPNLDAAKSAEDRRKQLEQLLATQSYVQDLVADDQQTLWESPTTGFPIDLSMVPPSPRMIAAVNWNAIYSSGQGAQTLTSLGPHMNAQLKDLEARTGFPLDEIKSMIVSLHSNDSFEYEVCAVVELVTPSPLEACLENWGQPSPTPGLEQTFEKASGTAWSIAKDSEENEITTFVVGPSILVQQVANGEVAVVSGPLRNLVANSDSDRDVNLIIPTIALFNTEGQKLFADRQKWLNEFRIAIPDSVRGLHISLHHDEGDYLEFRVDHTSALSSRETANSMRIRTVEKLEQLQLSMQQRQALPYWESLRSRYGAMLRELTEQLRWDSEFESVIGNAWLPPGAMHNLIAASELAMTFEPGIASVANADKPKTPQTLEELLATKRDLIIANPPDLNVLLKNIREEVSDQYLEMPFAFNIEIAGTDLQKEGITQNQRPGPLSIKDKSLADILTQLMVSANPNRDISGPADPNCKLIWVITNNTETGNKSVLITTRAAAAENGFQLPSAFVENP